MKLDTPIANFSFKTTDAILGFEPMLTPNQYKAITQGTSFDQRQDITKEMLRSMRKSNLITKDEYFDILEDTQNPNLAEERENSQTPSIRVIIQGKLVRLGPSLKGM